MYNSITAPLSVSSSIPRGVSPDSSPEKYHTTKQNRDPAGFLLIDVKRQTDLARTPNHSLSPLAATGGEREARAQAATAAKIVSRITRLTHNTAVTSTRGAGGSACSHLFSVFDYMTRRWFSKAFSLRYCTKVRILCRIYMCTPTVSSRGLVGGPGSHIWPPVACLMSCSRYRPPLVAHSDWSKSLAKKPL